MSYSRSTSPLPLPVNHQRDCMSAATKRWKYLRRMLKFDQMDFEFAFWQMIYLFIAPQKVYRNFQYRKRKYYYILLIVVSKYNFINKNVPIDISETKSQFARDDPAFLVLFAAWLCSKSIRFLQILKFLLIIIFVTVTSVGFAIVLRLTFWKFIYFLLYVIFIDCIGSGLLIATAFWYLLPVRGHLRIIMFSTFSS